MEKFTDIKLKSYSIKKEYYPEKSFVKCPDCPKLLHCSFCVQHLREQNPHHWVGIKINEVPGCPGCRERYLKGVAEAKNEAIWLKKKLSILEMRLASQAEDLRDAQELADKKLAAQQLAYEGTESVMEMNLRAQLEELKKSSNDAESIVGMNLCSELENMKELYEDVESKVTFLKHQAPISASAIPRGGQKGWTTPLFGDVIFVVQGREIYAHQLILLAQKTPKTLKEVGTQVQLLPPLPPSEPVFMEPQPAPQPESVPDEAKPATQMEPTREEVKNKPRQKTMKAYPLVKVKLAASPMLEQMGLRGIRCNLTVVGGQSLIDNETSQSTSSSLQLAQDPIEPSQLDGSLDATNTSSNDGSSNMEKNDIASVENNQQTQSKDMSPQTVKALKFEDTEKQQSMSTDHELMINTETSVPSISPAKSNNIQPQIIEPAPTYQIAPGPIKATSIPGLQTKPVENENSNSTQTENGALTDNKTEEPVGMMNVTEALSTASVQAAFAEVGTKAVIQVHDTSYEVMQAVIHCCYTADIVFTKDVPPIEVLKVAHKYKIHYLQDLCDQELCRRLNARNLPEMLKLGRRFGAKKLDLKATKFFKENFDAMQERVLDSCC